MSKLLAPAPHNPEREEQTRLWSSKWDDPLAQELQYLIAYHMGMGGEIDVEDLICDLVARLRDGRLKV